MSFVIGFVLEDAPLEILVITTSKQETQVTNKLRKEVSKNK